MFLSRLAFAGFVLSMASAVTQTCQPQQPTEPTTKVPIRHIVFNNDALLAPDKVQEIAQLVRNQTVDPKSLEHEMAAIAEEAGEPVRRALQDEGYFKAEVHAQAEEVAADQPQYDIVVVVRAAGRQYRLGDLNIVKATHFPTQQLRDLFPIQRGDIFSREKIEKGLERLRTLYNSEGFVNYTGVPDVEFDDENASANLTLDADEGKQFRFRSVEVFGLDSETTSRVLDAVQLKPGDVFNSELWGWSLLQFPDLSRYPAPHGGSKLDEPNGWVDMVLDFRKPPSCPIDMSVESAIELTGSSTTH